MDLNKFRLAVDRVRQVQGRSFVVGSIDYCTSQLLLRVGEPNKVVILSDGRCKFNSTALARLNLFRMVGGSVSAVGAGSKDDGALLRIAGGNKDLVFQVDSCVDVLTLQGSIGRLVSQICGAKEKIFKRYLESHSYLCYGPSIQIIFSIRT